MDFAFGCRIEDTTIPMVQEGVAFYVMVFWGEVLFK